MKSTLKKAIAIISGLFLIISVSAQDIGGIDVNSVSQSDIKKAQKAMQDAGLTIDQAAAIARQKGATDQQVNDFKKRLRLETQGPKQVNDTTKIGSVQSSELHKKKFSKKEVPIKPAKNKIFGAYLFNSQDLTFEPNINVQTPKNYKIGIDDQVLIYIWGNSQNNYQLFVNNNGQIIIPDVGPIYILGLTFEAAESKIKQRLTEIYSDMIGDNPGTFAQINLGQLRSIQVDMVGEVEAPGTYTLPATATVFNALYLSGGPKEIGSYRNIKVIRNNKLEKVIDIYKFLVDADAGDNITLNDGDIIFIPTIEKKVKVTGEFKRDGIYELKEGEMLSDLIRFAGGFTENAYQAKTKIFRKVQKGKEIIDVDYAKLASTPLLNGDLVTNTPIINEFKNRVVIAGAVYRPGEYEWQKGLTLSQLVAKADSLTPDAFQARGIIYRENNDLTTTSINFNVLEVNNGKKDILLQPEDSIVIKSHFDLKEQAYITVGGEVLQPNQFKWSEKLTLGDVIFMAGGLTEGADSTFIEIARRLSYSEASTLSDTLTHIIIADISRGLNIGENDGELKLKPFDQVSVRRAPNFGKGGSVIIGGEVAYAGSYAISNKKLRISDLVKMAGGITPQAYVNGATLHRHTTELGAEQVAIDLKEIMNNPKSESDLYLNNGDKIYIPEFMQTVKIVGNVHNPFSITYETGKKAKFYINRTGGFDNTAFKRKTYVQYPNGTTAVTKSFIFKSYPKVTPGSIVVVPEKPEKKIGENGKWLALASALASLTVSIAAVANAF